VRRVVVGVDDSPESHAALSWAVDYAELSEAQLHVVAVVPFPQMSALWTDRPADALPEVHLAAAQAEAGHLLDQLALERERPFTCPVQVHALVGHPASTLIGFSEGADLLVVGSRRPGPMSRLVLGSVSDAVARHARCPVAVIRQQ
jgi:nucleotide-binding universal stress UspA family protein